MIRYTMSAAEESRCHLPKGAGRTGRSSGDPRFQSRSPEKMSGTPVSAEAGIG
jgi:hypothetical protein